MSLLLWMAATSFRGCWCWRWTASPSSSTRHRVAAILVLLLSVGYPLGVEAGEYYALVLFATIGMMLMASRTDLLVIFLALELMSLSLYVLAGTFRTRPAGNEAALKYFLLGAFASGFFLYGIALHERDGDDQPGAARRRWPPRCRDRWSSPAGAALGRFGFKTSAVPFHQWVPDVYQGAPTAVAAFIATGPRPRPSGAPPRAGRHAGAPGGLGGGAGCWRRSR